LLLILKRKKMVGFFDVMYLWLTGLEWLLGLSLG
jgi:hypothetical protein